MAVFVYGGAGAVIPVGVTQSVSYGFGSWDGGASGGTVDTGAEIRISDTGNLGSIWCEVSTNDHSGTLTFCVTKDSARSTNTVASITSATTGEYEDLDDATPEGVVADNDVMLELVSSGGMHGETCVVRQWSVEYDNTTNDNGLAIYQDGSFPDTAHNQTVYMPLIGRAEASTTEAGHKTQIFAAEVVDHLRINISANTVGASSTHALRINGSTSTNLTQSIAADTSGLFSDTTGSDTLTADDELNHILTLGNGMAGDELRIESATLRIDGGEIPIGNSGAYTTTASTTNYLPLTGHQSATAVDATEGNVEVEVNEALDAANARVYLSTNSASGAASTVTLRDDGVDGNNVVSCTASTTGEFITNDQTDSIAAASKVNWEIVTASGGGLTIDLIQIDMPGIAAGAAVASLAFPQRRMQEHLLRR